MTLVPQDLTTYGLLKGGQPETVEAELAKDLLLPELQQVAQAERAVDESAIGQVDSIAGSVWATRTGGPRVPLSEGSAVFQGDEVETAADSSVEISFLDDSTFSLGPNAQMVLNELIYDPGTNQGSSLTSVLKGTFVFITGGVAETAPEAMKVNTPSGTIAVRGTKVGCAIGAEGTGTVCVLLVSDDGHIGEIIFSNETGNVQLSEAYATVIAPGFNAGLTTTTLSSEGALNILRDVLGNQPPIDTEAGEQRSENPLSSGSVFFQFPGDATALDANLLETIGDLTPSGTLNGTDALLLDLLAFLNDNLLLLLAELAADPDTLITVQPAVPRPPGVTISVESAGISNPVLFEEAGIGFGVISDNDVGTGIRVDEVNFIGGALSPALSEAITVSFGQVGTFAVVELSRFSPVNPEPAVVGDEQGQWVALLNGQVVAQDRFTANNPDGSFVLLVEVPGGFDTLRLSALPGTNQDGTEDPAGDSSDFFINSIVFGVSQSAGQSEDTVFVYNDVDDFDGGASGFDSLRFLLPEDEFSVEASVTQRLANIDLVDLTNGGMDQLGASPGAPAGDEALSVEDVLDITKDGEIFIVGDDGVDSVELATGEWVPQGGTVGTEGAAAGVAFDVFVSADPADDATLNIEQTLAVTGV